MADTELKKVPFLYKGTEKYSKQIKIASVFTSDKAIVTVTRLRYLIETEKIDLLNAYITDKDEVVLTNEYNTIKQNLAQLREFWNCPIDSPDILTDEQLRVADVLKGTLVELDVGRTSRNRYDEIVTKPLIVNAEGHYIEIDMDFRSWCNTVGGTVGVYRKDDTHLFNIQISKMSSQLLNEVTQVLRYLTDDCVEFDPDRPYRGDVVLSDVLEEYFDSNLYDLEYTDVDRINQLCEQFHIKEQYSQMLQARIDNVKKKVDSVQKFIRVAKDRHDIDLPDLETMILCFAFPRAYAGVDWATTIISNENGDFSTEHAKEYAIETRQKAIEFAEHQKLTELFGLKL